MRRTSAAEAVTAAEPTLAAAALADLCGRAGGVDPAATVFLDAFAAALADDALIAYEPRRALHAAATDRGDDDIARLFLQHGPSLDDPKLADAEAPSRAVVPRGRVLTLGERKALARGPRSEMLVHLLRDPHPDVVEILLGNPHLTESDALVLASRRPALPASLAAVHASDRWAARYRVKRALVLNPYAPLPLRLRLAVTLRSSDLEEVARDRAGGAALQVHARQLLLRRRSHRRARDRGSSRDE